MDILKKNIKLLKEEYKDIMEEYEEQFMKEYKEPAQRKGFLEKLIRVEKNMEKQIQVLNTDIMMLENRRHRKDFINQAKILDMKLDEIRLLSKELQFSSEFFNYKEIDKVTKAKEALNNLDFEGKTNDQLGNDRTIKAHKKNQILAVNDLYDDGIKRLIKMEENLDGANVKLKELTKEIQQQNIKLLEMDELIRETQSVLARMSQLVKFFNKVFLKDKCMNLMIMLMLLLCIGCVALIFMQGSSTTTTTAAATTTATTAATTTTATTAARILQQARQLTSGLFQSSNIGTGGDFGSGPPRILMSGSGLKGSAD